MPGVSLRLTAFLERRSRAVALALVAIASIRIVATYTVFNHTYDELEHLACGMKWLDRGVDRYETEHPPLARVMAALGPYLLGVRSQGTPHKEGAPAAAELGHEGASILFRDNRYDLTLAVARLGILPFFWIACLVVYKWGRRYFDPGVAVAALFFFSFLPPVLAHAGLATTDMALTAFLGAAFLAGLIWMERPTPARGALFGICTGLAVLSKFSSLVFLPASAALALIWYFATERPRFSRLASAVKERIPSFLLAVLAASFLIWAGYRFSFGKAGFANLRLPAPELFSAIREVVQHNARGHLTYLLGQRSQTGFWYFYPVALAVKTPLAFLLLLGGGFLLPFRTKGALRRFGPPLAFAAAILLVGFASRINIGIRHILPIYIAFSLLAAAAVLRLLQAVRRRRWVLAALVALLAWFAGSSLLSHPDYIAYFNELAGSEPEKILVDSDLDWGQDMKRLARRLREVGAQEVAFVEAEGQYHEMLAGMPPFGEMDLISPSPGWNAASVTVWKATRFGLFDRYQGLPFWTDRFQPEERVGKTILLWYFPPAGIPQR
jgi:hypothetical protein